MKSFQDKSLVLNFTPTLVPAAGMTTVLHAVPSTTRLQKKIIKQVVDMGDAK